MIAGQSSTLNILCARAESMLELVGPRPAARSERPAARDWPLAHSPSALLPGQIVLDEKTSTASKKAFDFIFKDKFNLANGNYKGVVEKVFYALFINKNHLNAIRTPESAQSNRNSPPPIIYREGRPSPSNLKVEPRKCLSFRSSLSNPIGEKPVFGKEYFGLNTSLLPEGSVTEDNVRPGHVEVSPNVPTAALQRAAGQTHIRGKFD